MKKIYFLILSFTTTLFCFAQVTTPVSLTTIGATYLQDFNTLASTSTSSTTPVGWGFVETGTSANTIYTAGTGSSTTGDTYSFGATSSTERAFGGLQSGSVNPTVGSAFTNNTGITITSLGISYIGEQWRLGALGRIDRLDFQYSTDATSLSTGTWTDINSLDFTAPTTGPTTGALDGNAVANRTSIGSVITGLSIPNGATFFIRWNDFNATGADDGLGVDDFSLVTNPPSVSISSSTNAAEAPVPTSGSFTITFAPATSVITTFNYSLTGTATFNTDYTVTLSGGATPSPLVAASGTITVPSLTSTITVTIAPIDDALVEGNETVILTISSASGGYLIGTSPLTITISDDDLPITLISAIQGSGSAAIPGNYAVQGIVTGVYPTLSPAGFYIEEEVSDWDADPNTSEGIFVVSSASVAVGDQVKVTGTAQEDALSPSFNQAVIHTASAIVISTGNPLPTTVDITLPVTATTDYEKYEGMLVRFPGTLTVSDNNNLGNFGEVNLSAGGLVYQPTQVVDPNDNPPGGTTSTGNSNAAAVTAYGLSNTLRTILLDDGRGSTATLPYVNVENTLRVGSTIDNISGILGYAFSKYRIQPTPSFSSIVFNHATRPAVPGYGAANLKVVSLNVLNYFNGDGLGGGFPTTRGANSLAEFNRQRDKIISAITQMNADVVGLIEMENDGIGANSAIQDLVNGLNAVLGAGTYSIINDGGGIQTGNSDQIRCGIIYKSTVVTPVGTAMLGSAAIFNRPPLAQTFNLISTNKKFNFVVNHFKSKGGTGTGLDADQGDGQAAFNETRRQQATALLSFFNTPTTGVIAVSGTDRILSVGDYNAYFEEDPMDILRAANYTVLGSYATYSFLFSGQLGSLDHAVISPTLAGTVTAFSKWNANSVEPEYLDYNDAINDGGGDVVNPWASTYTVSSWRSGDHDAIVMGLFLDAVLPITLVNFSAIKENAFTKIIWTTAQEINSDKFIVERSINGGASWQQIATVTASGNSNSPINYSITDVAPVKGTNLYRLKSVDLDAKFEYSAIRKVNFDVKFTYSLYPNPVKNVLNVIADDANGFNAQIELMNVQSQVLLQKRINSPGTSFQMDVSSLLPGLYFLKIITSDGTVTIQKLIKE